MTFRNTALLFGAAILYALSGNAQSGAIKTSQVNSTYYVGAVPGFYGTIQKAVDKACGLGAGTVNIPSGATPSDTIGAVTGGCTAVAIIDERPVPLQSYKWNGSAYAVASSSGGVSSGTTGQVAQYPANGSVVQGATMSGDATMANGGVVTVARVNGVAITGAPTGAGQAPVSTSTTAASWQTLPSGGGSSVGAAGTLQVVGSTPGSFGAGTPNQVNAAMGTSNGLYVFGDSISQATGASSTGAGNSYIQQGYTYLWQQAVGGTFLLGGTSGDQEADVNYKWIYRVASPQGNGVDPLYAHELGTNDAAVYQGDANKQKIFKRLALGSLAWLGTPQANKTLGQSCTLGGGMAADPSPLQVGMGVVATTNGATASCVVGAAKANDSLYACYLIQDADGGTFTLSLDGTPQTDPFNGTTTWDAFGDGGALIKTQNNVGAGVACARFTGLAGGYHTVLFTVTSATSGSNAVSPQWAGVAPASSALNPYVIAISPNQQNTGSAGAPYAATYAGYLNTIVGNLAADGENVSYSDTSNALLNDPSCGNGVQATMFANCYSDVIHPNNLGHSVMAKTVEASTPASFLLGATRWNPKQPLQNYNAIAGLTPYQWADLNPYNNYNAITGWGPGFKLSGANGQVYGIGTGPGGVTVIAPVGTHGFSVCPWGGGGFMPATPTPIANCFISVNMNGLVDLMGGGGASGISFQNNLAYTGTSFQFVSNGPFIVNGEHKSGVTSLTAATSGANSNSPCWYWKGGVWDAVLGQPGFDGPCLQFIPTSPTPAGKKGVGYLTLQPDGVVTDVGLDLSNTLLTNHLGTADASSISTTTLVVNGITFTPSFTLISPSLGGSALVAGACSSTTITQSGVGGTTRVAMTPNGGGPGDSFYWHAWGSAANTIEAQVCAVVAGTPAAQTYTLEVHP